MKPMPVCRGTLQRTLVIIKPNRFLFKMYKHKIWCLAVFASLILFAITGITSASVTPHVEGGYHWSMALKSDGTVWAWGENKSAQFGDGTYSDYSLIPIQTSDISNVTVIAAGLSHAMAIKSDGTLWTWGGNGGGQLGIGSYDNSETPIQVSSLSNIIAIDSGYQNSMALNSDGTVWTWGSNTTGQLGDGTNNGSNVPVQVSGLSDVVAIASGVGGQYGSGYSSHSLALQSDGTVWAWGANGSGQLGDGTNTEKNTPVQLSDLANIIAIAAGGGYDTEVASSEYAKGHSLALKSDGTVWSWGWNWAGQLGDGSNTDSNTPVQVIGINKVIAIASNGWDHCLALISDGTVWAWGNNDSGELGDGTNTNRNTPVQVSGLTEVAAIGGGYDHSLAVKLDGTVWAWGSNWSGELGNGTTTDKNIPVQANIDLGEITAQSPVASTNAATNTEYTTVTLTGTANSNGLNAAVWFEYGTSSASYSSESSAQIVTGSSDTSISIDVDGLSDGVTYYYRIAVQNPAVTTYGNEMSFTTTDATPPSGSVNINYGDTYTDSTAVTLTLSATDNVGVTGYFVSASPNAPSASDPSWVTISLSTRYSADVSYTMSGEDGETTVYVWFMDIAGYISDAASDTIVLDTTAPTVTITSPTSDANYTNSGTTLSLRGTASDDTSGIDSLEWSNDNGEDGTVTGTTNWSVFGINLSNGTNIITVTATDNAGNIGEDTITVTVASCDATTITSTPSSKLTINKSQSKDVIVTLSGEDNCAVEGETVTATINKAGKKRISISPSSDVTDEEGNIAFTITATEKTGNALVKFKAGSLKKYLTVKVKT